MNFIVAVIGIVGLYFILGMWHVLKASVAFTLFGVTFTWFFILLVVGSLLVIKVCLGGK